MDRTMQGKTPVSGTCEHLRSFDLPARKTTVFGAAAVHLRGALQSCSAKAGRWRAPLSADIRRSAAAGKDAAGEQRNRMMRRFRNAYHCQDNRPSSQRAGRDTAMVSSR